MSRCTICGSKSDCDEFCGHSFSDMRDEILLLRDEVKKRDELIKKVARNGNTNLFLMELIKPEIKKILEKE